MKIGIIALGWLGRILYSKLSRAGMEVIGSFASAPKGYPGEVRYDVNNDPLPEKFSDCDWIIFNLPPSKFTSEAFELFVKALDRQNLIFISSISVYGGEGSFNEEDEPKPQSENGKFLLKSEKLVLEKENGLVLRPAGLYGEGRHPGKHMSGRGIKAGPSERVNLVSGEDVSDLILKLMEDPRAPKIVNAVNCAHPLKIEYYQSYCLERNLDLVKFQRSAQAAKVVDTRHSSYKIASSLP